LAAKQAIVKKMPVRPDCRWYTLCRIVGNLSCKVVSFAPKSANRSWLKVVPFAPKRLVSFTPKLVVYFGAKYPGTSL